MSLVILSNTQEEYSVKTSGGEVRNTQTGIQRPSDLFYFYLGEGLRTNGTGVPTLSMNDTGSIPIPIRLNTGTYTINSMAQELQRALRALGLQSPLSTTRINVCGANMI